MHLRPTHLLLSLTLLAAAEGCGGSLAQPFDQLKGQPMTVYRLQNYAVQTAPSATAPAMQLPAQIQQWLSAGASLLPPGLIPPGLIPGTAPAAAPPPVPPFHGFQVLGWMQVADDKTKDEILDVFGHDSNFGDNHAGCMYAEVGLSLQQKAAPPADILVSLSCGQVQAYQFAWPYGLKTGLTPDTTKRIVDVVRKTFGADDHSVNVTLCLKPAAATSANIDQVPSVTLLST